MSPLRTMQATSNQSTEARQTNFTTIRERNCATCFSKVPLKIIILRTRTSWRKAGMYSYCQSSCVLIQLLPLKETCGASRAFSSRPRLFWIHVMICNFEELLTDLAAVQVAFFRVWCVASHSWRFLQSRTEDVYQIADICNRPE
jgi:hypothetical protein